MLEKAKVILKKIYGYDNFREGQIPIIESILNRDDTLGIIATGGGKSLCYQIPALIFHGLTIVISPLISLMKDQVDALRILGIKGGYLNSTLTSDEYLNIMRGLRTREIKILYVSPERLENERFIESIKKINVSLIAVDEAHCISQWGHDFRKSYLGIPKFIEKIGMEIPVLAITATATPQVKLDIVEKLNLKSPKIYIDTFERGNIYLKVEKNKDHMWFIFKYIKENIKQSGIIYAATRKEVDSICSYLKLKGLDVVKYHAGMETYEREKSQELFVKDKIKVIVATNAFGMGIDKSNVRYIIHRNIPKDIESYYQEIGRAGRDGAPSEAILLFYDEDEEIHNYFIKNNKELTKEQMNIKYDKLEKMIDYAYEDNCYKEYILKYFGEKRIKNYCGNCYNCSSEKDVEDLTVETQKILSCIGRAKESIGITSLSNILLGKLDTKLEKMNVEKLTTFGIMKGYDQIWIEELINYLLSEKYIVQSAGSFPVLQLTTKAKEILKGEKNIKRKKEQKVTFAYYENVIFQELLELRDKLGQRDRVAPYTIFSDLTLIEMSEKKPITRWDMLKIRGVGNQKFKSYGDEFIKILSKYY